MNRTSILFTITAAAWLMLLAACQTTPDFQSLRTEGVARPVLSLNGDWKFSMDVPEAYWEQEVDFSSWPDIKVPGECQMQGFAIRHDRPYVYKKEFDIPEDFAGRQILLVFHGVYSYARVWMNGAFIREHYGGFTRWECDITSHAVPGGRNVMTVEIVDRIDEISYASGYAKHQIGGILRDVELMARPSLNFSEFYIETDLDSDYRDAELELFYELSRPSSGGLRVELFDASNRRVAKTFLKQPEQRGQVRLKVRNPLKWDAEHPNLYGLVTTLSDRDGPLMSRTDKVGFREVVVDGNSLLVNGRPVKLRGADRHDIHPLLGRMTTPELDRQDVLLAKQANMNFIRTSHYPPSESFLRYCDQYGLYVEDETAVCFVHTHRAENYQAMGASQDDPHFTHRYLSQLKEMVDHHRNHPSVIIWSIGNENQYGQNFLQSYQWIKDTDRTRPVIFSYPGRVPDSLRIYDILSIHYPSWRGDREQYGFDIRGFDYGPMPVLFDEWAHVACYNKPTLREDPNVRNFWGQSLDSMWTYLFEAEGGLGGAIWCMIDETFMLPDTLDGFRDWWGWQEGVLDFEGPCVGYGEWGIIDTWRRKKPEFWGTKKAYSPAKVLVKTLEEFLPGRELRLPVHNRFDHTHFNELKIVWSYEGKTGTLGKQDLQPHQKGELVIPGMDWKKGTSLHLAFYREDTLLVDEYNLRLGRREPSSPGTGQGRLSVIEEAGRLIFRAEAFSLEVDQTTGLIRDLRSGEEVLIKSGPYLNLKIPGDRTYGSVESFVDLAGDWQCRDVRHTLGEGIAMVSVLGNYGSISVAFTYRVDGQGGIRLDYELYGLPEGEQLRVGGICFETGDAFRELSWDREAYFTAYPGPDLGNPRGTVDLARRLAMHYREEPGHDWVQDTKGFYYFGTDTQLAYSNLARSLKENIYSFGLQTGNGNGITVHGTGTQACRFDRKQNANILIINDLWDYPDLMWGNYMKHISLPPYLLGRVNLSLQAAPERLSKLDSPVLFRGHDSLAYRDPAVLFHEGTFYLFFTLTETEADDSLFWYTAVSKSGDLKTWTKPRKITPRDQHLNFSSPGNVVRFGDEWILCLQTYPIPGYTRGSGELRYGTGDSRIWIMRSRDLESWSDPELLRVKGNDVLRKDMGRMIDPYLIEDKDEPGRWWCFYKQNGVSYSWSHDLENWIFSGHTESGENVCVLTDRDGYLLFHSPPNGIGVKRSPDLDSWRDVGELITLGQAGWPWAERRITAGAVLDLRHEKAFGKYLMFYHGEGPGRENSIDTFVANCSIGIAWSDDLVRWDWPGKGAE